MIEGTFQHLAHTEYSHSTFKKPLTSHTPHAKAAARALPSPASSWAGQPRTRNCSHPCAHQPCTLQNGKSRHCSDKNQFSGSSPVKYLIFSIRHHKPEEGKLEGFFTHRCWCFRDLSPFQVTAAPARLEHHDVSAQVTLLTQSGLPQSSLMEQQEFPLCSHTALDFLRGRWAAFSCFPEMCF